MPKQNDSQQLPPPREAVFEPTVIWNVKESDTVVETFATPLEPEKGPSFSKLVSGFLHSQMRAIDYAAGDYVFRQGDPGDFLILIEQGDVEIRVEDGQGNSSIVDHSGPGDILGEMSLLGHSARTASVVATTPISARMMTADEFSDAARANPRIAVLLTQLMAERLSRDTGLLSGKSFEDYEIISRLGRGGMSTVYLAEDKRSDRRVALKMMSHQFAYDDAARDRFQMEADIIRRFDHRNIVSSYGHFEAFHTYFMVAEYCPGTDLQFSLAHSGPVDATVFRQLFGELASAIGYSHDRDIIHRDIKPANIMVTPNGHAKLMDFGLAESVSADDHELAEVICGTPSYMAPEQFSGAAPEPEGDYFALGCLAYEMLSGRKLFAANTFRELMQQHTDWNEPSLRELLPDVSVDLTGPFDACFKRSPAERHLDLQHLAAWAI